MKKLIILILLTLWAFVDAKAQSNYLLSGTVADVKILVQNITYPGFNGTGSYRDTTTATTGQELWYVTPIAYNQGVPIRAGDLQVIIANDKITWTKVSLYDFTGTNLIRTQNIAPNSEIIWGRFNGVGKPFNVGDFPLDGSKDYYWKFETIASQSPVCVNDVLSMVKNSSALFYVTANDLNLPSSRPPVRIKPGQNITGITVIPAVENRHFEVTSTATEGTFSFVYQVYSGEGAGLIIYGEATATVTVNGINQYCELNIINEKLVDGSTTAHEFTLASPNVGINPFNYTVGNLVTGNIDKSGTTPPATSNKEIIDFGNLVSGTYSVVFRSSTANCFASINVTHVNTSNICSVNISSIDKINGTNTYKANISYSNLTTLKSYVIASGATPLLPQVNISGSSFIINMTTLPQGTYTLNLENEGSRVCKAQKIFNHTFVLVGSGATKLETFTKYIHGYKDNWVVAGKTDNASGRDYFGQISFTESANSTVWKSFISDFENSGSSPLAKAIIGFRRDTARNEPSISVAVMPNQIILQERLTKSGNVNVLATIPNVSFPVWIRLTKTGSNLVAEYSKDLSMNPVYTEIATINGAFIGYTRYQKFLGATSAKPDVISSARFQGQLGGNVLFNSSTITVLPPVIVSNIASPSSGQSVALTTSTACIAPATNKWYKNGETLSFSAGSTVNVQAFHTDSYYARCENELNKSVKSNTILFTISNLVSCNNGTTPFTVATAVYASGNISFSFNASNLSNTNWTILNGSTVVKTSTLQPTTNTQTVNSGNLAAGNYIFKLDGISCNGTAQKAFTVAGSIIAPVIASVPSVPVTGDNITMTATGCVGNYNWYASGASTAYATNAGSSTINAVSAGTYYYATCIGSTNPSNYINVLSNSAGENDNGTIGQLSFVNPIKTVLNETVLGQYNTDAFNTIVVVNSPDPILGNKSFPNWSISWKVEGGNFSRATRNRKTPNLGIPFMFDLLPVPYGGYGLRCVDYVYPQNPNTGVVWTSDEACAGIEFNPYFNNQAHTIANFSSALPFQERAGDGGGAGLDRIAEWNGITDLAYFYDQGKIGAERFGLRDWVGSKANVGLSDYDNEATVVANKSLAILLGLASKSQGYVFDQYANILQGVYIDPSQYPLDFNNPASTYPQYTQLIDETNGAPNSGVAGLITNNVPVREFWNPSYKIAIASKFTGSRGVVDEPTILPSVEVSCISSATFTQGESYVFNTTGGTRVVNKFGLNANTQHMIARTIFAAETHKWYAVNKLNNRKMIIQAKILCDQQQNGLLLDQSYANTYITNPALANKHFNREHSFDIGAFVALTGCEWNVWDRNNADQNLDGYNGAFGIINLLNQKKTFGSISKSFVDLKPTAKFLLWTSEISYDNGNTYVREKASKYAMNQTSIPQRQFITPDGYWGGFLARPENTENTACILRVMFNGQNYTHTVTPSMWETVDYANRNTDLALLPNDKKDYYYFLVKLTNGATTEGTVVTPPTITKNIATPTANQSVTFTSSGCQSNSYETKWFDAAEGNLLATGLTFTVNAINGNGYFAKCVGGAGSSVTSNVITFSIASSTGVTIIEPAKTQYFYSNGQPPSFYASRVNLPAIITNTATFDEADVVKLKNSEVEFWFNLKRGGQICYASKASVPINRVYNGYDGGFQWVYDGAQYLVNGVLNGVPPAQTNNNINYNTTMGGDFQNKSQTLIDYHPVGNNGYYIKFRPILYNFIAKVSEIEIEVTYTLVGKSLKADYKYTSFRTDANIELNNPFRFMGFHVPICFLTNNFTKYSIYTGDAPWSNGTMTEGDIPNITGGINTPAGFQSKEFMGITFDPSNGFAVGVLNSIDNTNTQTSVTYEQLNKNQFSSAGTVFSGPYTTMALAESFAIPNGGNFQRNSTAYFTLGDSVSEVRNELKAKSGH